MKEVALVTITWSNHFPGAHITIRPQPFFIQRVRKIYQSSVEPAEVRSDLIACSSGVELKSPKIIAFTPDWSLSNNESTFSLTIEAIRSL